MWGGMDTRAAPFGNAARFVSSQADHRQRVIPSGSSPAGVARGTGQLGGNPVAPQIVAGPRVEGGQPIAFAASPPGLRLGREEGAEGVPRPRPPRPWPARTRPDRVPAQDGRHGWSPIGARWRSTLESRHPGRAV